MNGDENISEEEMRKILERMGIPLDAWQNTKPEGDRMIKTLPTFERIAERLSFVKGHLEKQIEQDREQIAALHEKEQRLKHGGGR